MFSKGLDKLKKPLLNNSSDQDLQSLEQAAADGDDRVAKCIETSKPVLACLSQVVEAAVPIITEVYVYLKALYDVAPRNLLSMLFGLALCFFGGVFAASIAASPSSPPKSSSAASRSFGFTFLKSNTFNFFSL